MLYREIIAVCSQIHTKHVNTLNLLNAELNPTCHLLALLGAHHILHVSRTRVNVTYLFIYSVQLCSTPILFAATAQSWYLRRYMFRQPVVAVIMIHKQRSVCQWKAQPSSVQCYWTDWYSNYSTSVRVSARCSVLYCSVLRHSVLT